MIHDHRTTHRTRGHGGGFTLVELLVAMAVTLLLLLFINGVFSTLSTGVSAGLATSEIVHTSRAINAQINRDAREMVGPDDDGVLIITNQWIGNDTDPVAPFGVPFTETDFPEDDNIGLLYRRRADQITFIRKADSLQPMTPQRREFLTPARDVQAAYARVSYGHALRVSADGYDDGDPVLGADDPNDLNRFAARWVLGRQALLMATDLGTADIFAEHAVSHPHPDAVASVIERGGLEGLIYEGYTDIAAQGYLDRSEYINRFDERRAMVGPDADAATHADEWWRLFRNLPRGEEDNAWDWDGYFTRALAYTYTLQRLHVNPRPLYLREQDTGDGIDRRYTWQQVMQMHPILATGVTDFIVEFAGPFDPDQDAPAGQPRPQPMDVIVDDTQENGEEGRIRWYSIDNIFDEYWDIFEDYFGATAGEFDPIFGWVEDEDDRGVLAMVFRHGPGDQTRWPHLIRIRYRLTDAQARLTGQDDAPGRMYEQIIRVPRSE